MLAHRGLDKPQIGVALGIDEAAARQALSGAIEKLCADTLSEALDAARQLGLVR